jgi:hypothetical protein
MLSKFIGKSNQNLCKRDANYIPKIRKIQSDFKGFAVNYDSRAMRRRWKSLAGREIKCNFWFRMLKFLREIWIGIGIGVDKLESKSERWNRNRNVNQRLNMFMESNWTCWIGLEFMELNRNANLRLNVLESDWSLWNFWDEDVRGWTCSCSVRERRCVFCVPNSLTNSLCVLLTKNKSLKCDTFWKVLLIHCYLRPLVTF